MFLERGEVLDLASDKLANIRREVQVARDRLMSCLEKYLTDSANKLQEPIITQRDGRYVIPLRAEFKGSIKAIVHDQSSSGATLFVSRCLWSNSTIKSVNLNSQNDEERRILAELSALVGEHAAELKYGIENLAVLDLAFAKAKYAEEITRANQCFTKWRMDYREWENQPFIIPFSTPAIHCSIQTPLCPLISIRSLARAPLLSPDQIPAARPFRSRPSACWRSWLKADCTSPREQLGASLLPRFFADIGDEQSIEQSLSTFSSHITNIIRILKKADASLVILDELGAGTDPQEGAALARAILSHLIERGITTFVATHYPELKTFAHSTDGVVNASLEFDVQTLRPTYHLTIGLPGRSNALAIAQRLGLDPQLVAVARSEINPDDLRADKLLDDIRKERNRTSRAGEKLEKARVKLEAQTHELDKRLEKIEDERREVLAKARAEANLKWRY